MTNQEKITKSFNEPYDFVDMPIIKSMIDDLIMYAPIEQIEKLSGIVITDLKEQFVDVRLAVQADFYKQNRYEKLEIIDGLLNQNYNKQKFHIN